MIFNNIYDYLEYENETNWKSNKKDLQAIKLLKNLN